MIVHPTAPPDTTAALRHCLTLHGAAVRLAGTTDPDEVETLRAIARRASADLARALGVRV